MDPSQGGKTTMDREILERSEGERTKDLILEAKGFMKNYFSIWAAELAAEELRKELAELKELANLYREDAVMTFDGENIQGREAIRAKFSSLNLSRIQVLNIECLPVGGTGFNSGTGGTDLSSGFYGMGCGYIWQDGKQEARFFSQTFSLHPTPEGSFVISNSIFIHIGMESYGAGTGTTRPSPFP